jgi:hypothetical protein
MRLTLRKVVHANIDRVDTDSDRVAGRIAR